MPARRRDRLGAAEAIAAHTAAAHTQLTSAMITFTRLTNGGSMQPPP